MGSGQDASPREKFRKVAGKMKKRLQDSDVGSQVKGLLELSPHLSSASREDLAYLGSLKIFNGLVNLLRMGDWNTRVSSLSALATLAQVPSNIPEILVVPGVLDTLLDTILIGQEETRATATRLLCFLAVTPEVQRAVATPRTVDGLVSLMRGGTAKSKQVAAEAISALSQSAGVAAMVGQSSDAIACCVQCLADSNDTSMIEAVLGATAALLADVQNGARFLSIPSSVDRLIFLMGSPPSATTLYLSCASVANLTMHQDLARHVSTTPNLLPALAAALKHGHPNTTHACIMSLCSITRIAELLSAVAQNGSLLQGLLAAMTSEYPHTRTAATRTFAQLAALPSNHTPLAVYPRVFETLIAVGLSDDQIIRELTADVVASFCRDQGLCSRFASTQGALPLLLGFLQVGPQSARVSATRTLGEVTRLEMYRPTLVRLPGLVASLTRVIIDGDDSVKVVAARCLEELTSSPDLASHVFGVDGLMTGLALMIHNSQPAMHQVAMCVLSNLTVLPDARFVIAREPYLLESVVALLTNESVATACDAADCLAYLAIDGRLQVFLTANFPNLAEKLVTLLRHPASQESATVALANLMVHPDSRRIIVRAADLPALLGDVMMNNVGPVRDMAVHAIANMSSSPETCAALGASVMRSLVEMLMDQRIGDATASVLARTVANSCVVRENALLLVETQGALMALLGKLSHNELAVSHNSANAVFTICNHEETHLRVAQTGDAIATMLSVLRLGSPPLQSLMLACIGKVVTNEKAAETLVALPSFPVLLSLINSGSPDMVAAFDFQLSAILHHLAQHAPVVPAYARVPGVVTGLLRLLVVAANDEMRVNASWALQVVTSESMSSCMEIKDGIEVLAPLLKKEDNREVQTTIAVVVANVTTDASCGKRVFQSRDMYDQILVLLATGSEVAREAAARTLANLSLTSEHRDAIAQNDSALSRLVSLLTSSAYASARVHAASCLANLAASSEANKTRVGSKANALNSLVSLVRDGQPAAQEHAALALSLLVADHADNAKRLLATVAGVKTLQDAAVKSSNPALQSRILVALMNVALSGGGPGLMDAGVVDTLKRLMDEPHMEAAARMAVAVTLGYLTGQQEDSPICGQTSLLQYLVKLATEIDVSQQWKVVAALTALRNVSHCDRNKDILLRAGLADVVVSHLRKGPQGKQLTMLLEIAWNLSLQKAGKATLLKYGVMEVLAGLSDKEQTTLIRDVVFAINIPEHSVAELVSPTAVAHVFVAYSQPQFARVSELASALRSFGYSVWMEPAADRQPLADMARWVATSSAIITCFDAEYQLSVRARTQIHLAVSHDKAIFPVRLQAIEPKAWLQAVVELSSKDTGLPWPFYYDVCATRFEAVVQQLVGGLGRRGLDILVPPAPALKAMPTYTSPATSDTSSSGAGVATATTTDSSQSQGQLFTVPGVSAVVSAPRIGSLPRTSVVPAAVPVAPLVLVRTETPSSAFPEGSEDGSEWDAGSVASRFDSNKGIPAQPLSTAPVSSWTISDVANWLSHAGLSVFRKTFEDNEIVGADLVDLTDEDLSHFGLRPFQVRRFRKSFVPLPK